MMMMMMMMMIMMVVVVVSTKGIHYISLPNMAKIFHDQYPNLK